MAPAHAMVLGPVDTATGSFLDLLNGTRGLPLLRDLGRAMGLPDGHVDALVERLARSGLLDDATGGGRAADCARRRRSWTGSAPTSRPVPRRRRAGRRPEASGRPPLPAGAGAVRPGGAVLASLLAGAGWPGPRRDIGSVEPWDVAPGGLPSASIGERREEAARRAVRRAAPDQPRPTAEGEELGLSLVILAPRDGLAVHAPDPAVAEPLITSGTPHLYAGVVEGTGVVGPLVLPGDTGCAGCLDQQRIDRDPTWPRLIAQWCSGASHQVPACDLALATGVAGLAAGHALAFLDGRLPSSAGARWQSPCRASTGMRSRCGRIPHAVRRGGEK